MKYVVLTSSLLLSATMAAALAEPPQAKRRQKQPSTQRHVDPFEAVRALRIEVETIDLREVPFDEFAAWLSRQSGVNVVPRWDVLAKSGVERDAPVTLKLKHVTLGEALRGVLTQLEEGHKPLGFRAHSNIVTISTKADLDKQMIVRTYDVQDLILLVPNFQAAAPTGIPIVGAVKGDQKQHAEKDPLKEAGEQVRTLASAIIDSVYPDSWKEHGGSGTITYFRGHLVVRNTPDVHEILSGQLRVLPSEH